MLSGLQSPWIIDGQRKGISSVEERIADAVVPAFQADRHKFMTAGNDALLCPSSAQDACMYPEQIGTP